MDSQIYLGLVDGESLLSNGLVHLFEHEGFVVQRFSSAKCILEPGVLARLDVLLVDLALPCKGGLGLLHKVGPSVPVIFLSGSASVSDIVEAMKSGAVDFLTKPFDAKKLLLAVHESVTNSRKKNQSLSCSPDPQLLFQSLTPREREVMQHVIAGKRNKQTAIELGISEHTVKVHRMRITKKTKLTSLVDLVRACDRAGIEPL